MYNGSGGHYNGANSGANISSPNTQYHSGRTNTLVDESYGHGSSYAKLPPGMTPGCGQTTGRTGWTPTVAEDEFQDETLYFERNRIQHLKDERVHIQKKTFMKWCNSYLNKARLEIEDLFTDFGDGILLLKFLEIISGEKLGKPNRGRMRVQKIENLNKCLEFLKYKRIQLENIGAEDILDGNERLILGLIWTIILRFTIENIEIEGKESGERKHAKEALLLWCQRKTIGYPNIKIDNFTSSWRNGLAFNALIHAHRPELVSFESLNSQDAIGNLNSAFDIAEKKLDIARLLDAEDIIVSHPDEKSIITYVSLYYHYFAKQKTELTGARRVAKVVGGLVEQDSLQDDYEQLSSELLIWIQRTIEWLTDCLFPNSLKEMQTQLLAFNEYRKADKPPKYKEKGDLEALFFAIQTKRNAMKRRPYQPPEGLFIHDVESAWNRLDKAENDRQQALIHEIQRQERLEVKARIFHKKAEVRDAWLCDIILVLQHFELQPTLTKVEAASKMLRNISTQAGPKTDRFKMLSEMSAELQRDRFHDSEAIRQREREIIDRWNQFLAMLHAKERQLGGLRDFTTLVRDFGTLADELRHVEPSMRNRDLGKHMLAVNDYLQKHELIEANVNANGEWLSNLKKQALEYIHSKGEMFESLQARMEEVERDYARLVDLCRERRAVLQRAREFFQFVETFEEEMNWLTEKRDFCTSQLAQRDIGNVPHATRQYKVLEAEMNAHWQRSKGVINDGERLSVGRGSTRDECRRNIAALQSRWEALRRLAAALSKWLEDAEQARQYFQDANDTESWIKEKMPLVLSDDFGRDLSAAESLSSRHARLIEEINAYRADIHRLDEAAAQLARTQFNFATNEMTKETTNMDSTKKQTKMRVEELVVPKLVALYAFDGRTGGDSAADESGASAIHVKRDELLALLDKTNDEWWRVLKHDGTEGYVPANYCREVAGETVTVSQQVAVPMKTRTKKSASADSVDNTVSGGGNAILARQETINADYRQLTSLAKNRQRFLSDAIKLFRFYHHCDDFEAWAKMSGALFQEDIAVEHVEALRKKFKKLENDLQTIGGVQLKLINEMADELITQGHTHSDNIAARQQRVTQLWNELQNMWKSKANDLASAEQMTAFNECCAEMRSWISEKFALLEKRADVGDLKALQALQRRYQNLERDLRPLDERMCQLRKMAAEIIGRHPEHRADVERAMAELGASHADLLKQARQRINEAEQSQGQQMFDEAARELLDWLAKTYQNMQLDADSAAPAEELVKRHAEISDQVIAKQYEFDYVRELAERLLAKNARLPHVTDTLTAVEGAKRAFDNAWLAQERDYKQLLELQVFAREADRIDALTRAHEAFLDLDNLGDTADNVENLIKAHADFESKLAAQEERVAAFAEAADRLIHASTNGETHKHAVNIDERRVAVLAGRERVYLLAARRRARLNDALAFQNWRRVADELSAWIGVKRRVADVNTVASGDSSETAAPLTSQLLRHEAFVAELNFNATQLDMINKEGNALVTRSHTEKPRISVLLSNLNRDWRQLSELADVRGAQLAQSDAKSALLKQVEDVHARLGDIERQLASVAHGNDLRSVKELISRKHAVEQEVGVLEQRVTDILQRASAMVSAGHFDAPAILKVVDALTGRFDALQKPLEIRRVLLDESLRCHQLAFDADVELQWIEAKRLLAESRQPARTLIETTNQLKKHDQLDTEVRAHEPAVCAVLVNFDALHAEIVHQKLFAPLIGSKYGELSAAWRALGASVVERRKFLASAVAHEQYLHDVGEVEAWIADRHRYILNQCNEKVDQISTPKSLGAVRAVLNDMGVYKDILMELAGRCAKLSGDAEERANFVRRQQKVEDDFELLREMAEEKCAKLENFIDLFVLDNEGHELETWINAQMQTALSEDYGRDYEHLLALKSKFDEFKQSVRAAGGERYAQFDAGIRQLLERRPTFMQELVERQERVAGAWRQLVAAADAREDQLAAAERLHRFDRDAGELAERVAEKRVALSPLELGRDAKHACSLILKHEVFEHEIDQLREQLNDLIKDGASLQSAYPGTNADQIADRLSALTGVWHELKETAISHGTRLLASYEFQKFLSRARDFIGWATQVIAEMQSDAPVRDLQAAEWIQQEHHRLRSEIDGRQAEYAAICADGGTLIAQRHYASADIGARLAAIERAYADVKQEWKLRNEWVAQIVDWHGFEREARQNIAAIEARERTLAATPVGGSVGEVEAQMRRFDTFTRALAQLEERVSSLGALAGQLIERRHMKASNIDAWNRKVLSALNHLGGRLDAFKRRLERALTLAGVDSDIMAMSRWCDEKLRRLDAVLPTGSASGSPSGLSSESTGQLTLSDKLAHLKRHQALEIELAANRLRIDALASQLNALRTEDTDDKLVTAEHTNTVTLRAVIDRGDRLMRKWEDLNEAVAQMNAALKEAKDLFDFNDSADRVLAWVRDKELILSAQDLGRDYEHANALLEKIVGQNADQSVDATTVQHVNRLGARLIAAGSDSREEIQRRLDKLNETWNDFQNRMNAYRETLRAALAVHRFNGDVDETNARIQEKANLLASDELGRSLADVERLLRKQDATERDMSAIHGKLNAHDEAAKSLLAGRLPLADTVASSLKKLEVSWEALAELAHSRRLQLQQSYNLQKYFDAVKKLETWANAMRTKMRSIPAVRSVRDAENALKTHGERLAEIEARDEELKALREHAQRLAAEQPDHRPEIQRAGRRLQNVEHQIRQTWEQENVALKRAFQLQTLNAQIQQTESWLAAKEVFVNQYELGDSVDAVEVLLRKYDAFTQTLYSQADKVEQLTTAAKAVLPAAVLEESASDAAPLTPDVERVAEKYHEILGRHKALLAASATKRRRLNDSRRLHAFIRECSEMIVWMNAKLQLAYDDMFIDPTSLRSKLHKQTAFVAELDASAERVEALRRDGRRLAAELDGADAERVDAQLNEVIKGWTELNTKSANKTTTLRQAYDAYQLSRRLAELDKWLDDIELALANNDHGGDADEVERLIQGHAHLAAEIDARWPAVDDAVKRAAELRAKNYEHDGELTTQAEAVRQRFDSLAEPCQIRRENLDDSLRFFQWAAEVDEQLAWINDKVPQLESTEYGRSLHSTQSLNKKHQIVEQEIATRAPIIEALVCDERVAHATAAGALEADPMVTEILARVAELRDGFALLGALGEARAQRLAESLRSQEYYTEASEAEQWIIEHLNVIAAANEESITHGGGSHYLSADVHLRRLAALEGEIGAFVDEIGRLRTAADTMINGGHFDVTQLSTRQLKLEELLEALRAACNQRRAQLVDAGRYHAFVRQADDLIIWLREHRRLAEREDYGADLEDCMMLIEQFEQVVRELSAAGERVAAVRKMQEGLLRAAHPNAGSIRAKMQDLERLWQDVNEAANDRQQALQDGRNIHVFDQKADEMLNRLAEQEAYIVAVDGEELTVGDSATVQAFVQRHDDFLHALYVLEKQVADACREADRIVQQFPRTQDHLDVRRDELIEQLKDVKAGGHRFSERLAQAQKSQAYFQEYRDMINWIRHMYTTITGEILPRDVAGCEALNSRHSEYRAEIEAHDAQKAAFVENGRKMIQAGSALANEIASKLEDLEHGFRQLYETWHRRQTVYDENLDVQQWMSGAEFLENWLTERQQFLTEDWHTAEGVEYVEDLIRHFDDFLATLDAQSPHFEALKRLTKLETSYRKMQQEESAGLRRRDSSSNVSVEPTANRRDTQQIKTLEKKKLLQEKRQERERRKTQEISLMRRTPSQEINADFTTLPRVRTTSRHSTISAELDGGIALRNSAALLGTVERPRSSAAFDDTLRLRAQIDATHSTMSEAPGAAALRRRQSLAARTPGFTTRRPQSIKKLRQWDDLKSIDMHGYIDRKQELQGGGKKATFRSWKNYYTILCGQLLCFFKDEESFMENMAAAPPVYIMNSACSIHADYVKRKHTFKLNTRDGAEYLFAAETGAKMIEWMEKINFHAGLTPSNQLVSFETVTLPSAYYAPGSSGGNELTRSHTLELSASYGGGTSSARNSIHLSATDTSADALELKFATLDYPRRAPPGVPKPRRGVQALAPTASELTTTATFTHSSTTVAAIEPVTGPMITAFHSSYGSSASTVPDENRATSVSLSGGSESDGVVPPPPAHSRSQSQLGPDAEFVGWVETNAVSRILPAEGRKKSATVTDRDDESLRSVVSKKRSVISLFKRSSKNLNNNNTIVNNNNK